MNEPINFVKNAMVCGHGTCESLRRTARSDYGPTSKTEQQYHRWHVNNS